MHPDLAFLQLTPARAALRTAAFSGVLLLAVAACGGSGGGSSSTSETGSTGQAATASQSAASQSASASETGTPASSAASQVPASQPAGDCVHGPTKIDGIDVVQHCGPATGEFTEGGTTVKVSQGLCETSMGAWSLNIGATVVDMSASQEQRGAIPYLGIVAGEPVLDGTGPKDVDPAKVPAKDVIVTFTGGGIADSIKSGSVKFEVTGPGPSGTFSGPTIDGKKATGSFSCG
jgi:hypothetical protein